MLRRENGPDSPKVKKIHFRGDKTSVSYESKIEEIFDNNIEGKTKNNESNVENPSLLDFIKIELTRGYILEHDEERYSARREKIYSFMKIPREVEKFMLYGVMQCTDSFLYIHTFLPIRYFLALWALFRRCLSFGLRRRKQRLLTPAEICDLLKGSIWIICCFLMLSVDTNKMYHIIKTQSIIKLYIFYNILEVGDRLLSAFGQDAIDALFWTATEPKNKRREHFGLIPHILFALVYIILHSFLIIFQATTLNVAVNSNNKSFLTIMMSNNFVELKGSVFKKFDKNNLFQLTCSDVRERFHLSILLFIVVIQTMKEFSWSMDQFYVMLPDCCYVLISEVLIDWVKHAFITRFNEIPVDVYREYTTSLAYDMTQTRQKHAFSDHSDLVARRMGFIPFPLSVVLIKTIYAAVSFDNFPSFLLLIFGFITLTACKILNTICALGKACELMKQHQMERTQTNTTPPSSSTSVGNSNIIITSSETKILSSNANNYLQRSQKIDIVELKVKENDDDTKTNLTTTNTNNPEHNSSSLDLGATALFSNSELVLDDVRLNDKILNNNKTETVFEEDLKRSESEPSMQTMLNEKDK